jgi:hypothetical protein
VPVPADGVGGKIRDAAISEADPDARIVKMLGARATFVRGPRGLRPKP